MKCECPSNDKGNRQAGSGISCLSTPLLRKHAVISANYKLVMSDAGVIPTSQLQAFQHCTHGSRGWLMRGIRASTLVCGARLNAAEVRHAKYALQTSQITASVVRSSPAAELRRSMLSHTSLTDAFKSYTQSDGAAAQEQRHGSLAATCMPPSAEAVALGPRVEHLSDAGTSTIMQLVAHQLKLPQVSHQL